MLKYLKFANLLSLIAFISLTLMNTFSKFKGIQPEPYLMTSMAISGGLTIGIFVIILATIIISAYKNAKKHPHP